MLLLSIDTSGRNGSIAFAHGFDDGQCKIVASVALDGGTFSAQLIPQVSELLKKNGFMKNEIDGFVVAAGPGSFTGLRVGLSAVKGLAEALLKPIAAVSLLEALTLTAGKSGRVMAALDAGRGDAYVGEYEIAGNTARLIREELLTQAELLDSAKPAGFVTSDTALAEKAKSAGVATTLIEGMSAGSIVSLGWKKIKSGEVISSENLEANYIRRTDAELLAKVR